MDVIFYLAVLALIVTIPSLVIGTIIFLLKPHLINNRLKKRHLSRKKILSGGILASFLSLVIFSSVMAATEPASLKAQIAADQATTKAQQLKQQELNHLQQVQSVHQPKVETKQVTTTQTIAFDQQEQDDPTLAQGQTKITQAGVNGEETTTYSVTYTDGKETDRQKISDVTTKEPVSQITTQGIYVAPAPAPAPAPSTPSPSSSASCSPLTNGGNCYEPGEYCRNSDHGLTGVAGDGEQITCANNNGWRWEP